MRTKLFFYWILSVVWMQALAWGAIAASQAPETIPVGALVSLSGFDSNLGLQAKAGYEIATEDINRTGGIFVKEYGKKIPLELMVQDIESSPTKAISRMEWLYTSKKNLVAYLGTQLVSAGSGVAEKNKIPTIAVASPRKVHHDRGLRYWFSPTGKTPDMARIVFDLMDTIPAEKWSKSAAIFEEQGDFGVEITEFFKKEASARNYKIVAHEKYSPLSKDFSPLIMAAKKAGAEVVLSSPVTPDGMLMIRQMKELDYNAKVLVLFRAAEDLSWAKAMGPMGDYVIGTSFWHHRVKYPGVDKLNATYQSMFGRPADMHTGPAYASIQILAAAIEKAGTLDTTKIREAIAATDMMTVMGKVKFRPDATPIDPCPAIFQWQAGSQKLVWPKEFRDAPLVYAVPAWQER